MATPALLFLPDISGFTRFVTDTEIAHGRHVIAELLELIIDADELGLTVAEIEGDAVFFYREGGSPGFDALTRQARRTFEAFHAHLKSYETNRICDCGACSTAHQLTLKIVAHAGPIDLISVRGFEKPYGPDVIVAHRLLKNDVQDEEYLLVTESAVDVAEPPSGSPEWASARAGTAMVDDVGEVPYRYVSLSHLRDHIPDPAPRPVFEKNERPYRVSIHVDEEPARVFELISNLDLRLRWNKGVDDLEYEPGRMNRVGTKHRCVIGGDLIEFETVTNDFGPDRYVYGEYLADNPLVDELAVYYVVSPDGTGSRVDLELHYQRKAFPRSLLAPLVRWRFSRFIPGTLAAIKQAAESGTPLFEPDPLAPVGV